MINGITKIKPFDMGEITGMDFWSAMMKDCGCSVSSMPDMGETKPYTNNWEYFNPERVEYPERLPDYWGKVYELHNKPEMGDCVRFRYRYVHVPIKIMCRYPRIPVCGVFVLDNNNVKYNAIKANDLIWIGDEIEEEK